MKHLPYWIVGLPEFGAEGTAPAILASSKTDSRRAAEARLAKAEFEWGRRQKSARRLREEYASGPWRRPEGETEYAFARWMASSNTHNGVPWKWFLLLQNGVTILGPAGERIRITEPSAKARAVYAARVESDRRAGESAAAAVNTLLRNSRGAAS